MDSVNIYIIKTKQLGDIRVAATSFTQAIARVKDLTIEAIKRAES